MKSDAERRAEYEKFKQIDAAFRLGERRSPCGRPRASERR
jgi:hypothetical protein